MVGPFPERADTGRSGSGPYLESARRGYENAAPTITLRTRQGEEPCDG